MHGNLDAHLRQLTQLNKQGAGVFVSINETDGRGRRKENIKRVRAVCVDLDGAPLAPVQEFDLAPHVIVEPSPGRFHAHWRVKGFRLEDFGGVQRAIARRFDGDTGIAKLTHCARLPGFDHCKDPDNRFRVRIVEESDSRPYTAEDILAAFPPEAKPHKPPSSRSGVVIPKGNHVEAAREFARRTFTRDDCHGCIGLVAHRGEFFRWTGTHYEPIGPRNLRSDIYGFLDDTWVQHAGKHEPFNPSKGKVAEVLAALDAGVNEDETVDPPFWQPVASDVQARSESGQLICTRNGLLDIEAGKLLPHNPLFFNTLCLPFDCEPEAAKPTRWFTFLRELWPDDKAARQTLAEIFGYLLTADTSQQKMFLVVGPKRSGKGTLARVLAALLGGKANVATPTLASLSQEFGLWPLIHKPLAIISDARLGGRTNTATVVERLLSISGEDDQTVNRKFLSHWSGRLRARFLVLTNELPQFTDAAEALASRFVILTLKESFYGKEDIKLTEALLKELPGILNWSLAGLKRLRTRGLFEMPQSSHEAVRTLEDLGSPAGAFVRDWCDVGPGKTENVKLLYAAWRAWCEAKGEKAGSDITFGKNLRAVVPGVSTKGAGRARSYRGVALNVEGRRRYKAVGK
ncbi:MAG: NTP-binding protein [Gammaproteobacteria bacterium]|nr:NTP-binding protein [Gammaproteobacteria bacterium]